MLLLVALCCSARLGDDDDDWLDLSACTPANLRTYYSVATQRPELAFLNHARGGAQARRPACLTG